MASAAKVPIWATEGFMETVLGFQRDPLGFVEWAFDWGHGDLENRKIEDWQRKVLAKMGEELQALPHLGSGEEFHGVIRRAVASGHGIGKSALISWIILWGMSTMVDTRGVITANTDTQLRTKTMPTLVTWHGRCLTAPWFDVTATAIFSKDPRHERTWRMDAIPWSEHNPEAFAGMHNQGKRIILLFDEASAIARTIWETSEGAMTDASTEIIWMAFGNPTQATGPFRECFGRFSHRWSPMSVDSREVSFANTSQIEQWINDYGEDSDFVRIRVKGVFPRQSSRAVNGVGDVEAAMAREGQDVRHAPVIVGADIARFGEDRTVFACRIGRDAAVHPWKVYRGLPVDQVAQRLAAYCKEVKAEVINIDNGAMGAGVVDLLRSWGFVVNEVNFGGKTLNSEQYRYKRDEMWFDCAQWIKDGGRLPKDNDLLADLTGPEYDFDTQGRSLVWSKKKMREEGLASPDMGDALALTFAVPVAARVTEYPGQKGKPMTANSSYKVL